MTDPGRDAGAVIHRRILAVVNPVSGVYPKQRTIRDLKHQAERMGLELDVIETRKDLNGEQAVKSRTGDYDCYLAAGGDGTVIEVAQAASEDGVPLAVLPRGTANALAWHFKLPIDEGQALKVASRGKPMKVDIATSSEGEFLIMAGLGYDAHVIRAATRSLKKRLGFLAYLFAAVKPIGRRPYVFRVMVDDEEPVRVKGVTAIVANTGTLAGNLRFVQKVSPHDGLLDAVVIYPENLGIFFRMAFWALLGRLNQDPRVKYFRGRKIAIQCRPEAPLEIDGDEVGNRREFTAEVRPGALTLMVLSEGMSWFPWPEKWLPGHFPWSKWMEDHRSLTGESDPDPDPDPVSGEVPGS